MNSLFLSTVPLLNDFGYLPHSSTGAMVMSLDECAVVIKIDETPEIEVAAFRIDEVLGWNLVPPTVVREFNDESCSVQLFINNVVNAHQLIEDGDIYINPYGKCYKVDNEYIQKQREKVHIFDQLIGNEDRHVWNWLIDPETYKVWAIDHSSDWAFCTGEYIDEFDVRDIFSRQPELKNDLLRLLNEEPEDIRGLLSDSEYSFYRQRLEKLANFEIGENN